MGLTTTKYVEPAPEREKTRTWKHFMKAHWDSLCGCDFFTIEALGLTGTVRYMVFFVMVVKTRAVEIAGIATNPDGRWMQQMARNLTDTMNGFLRNASYLLRDRDPLFTEAFEAILRERGVKCVRISAQSPNCNPHAERFVKTVRDECLHHFVVFGFESGVCYAGVDTVHDPRQGKRVSPTGVHCGKSDCSRFPTNGVAAVPTSCLLVKMTVILCG